MAPLIFTLGVRRGGQLDPPPPVAAKRWGRNPTPPSGWRFIFAYILCSYCGVCRSVWAGGRVLIREGSGVAVRGT
jgi:hypothetical protein